MWTKESEESFLSGENEIEQMNRELERCNIKVAT